VDAMSAQLRERLRSIPGINVTHVGLLDAVGGNKQVEFSLQGDDLAELERLYSGHALFARPRFRQDGHLEHGVASEQRNWFWGTLSRSWRIYRDVLLASLMINLFGLTGPFFTMIVYDRVIPNLAFETLWVLALGIGTVYGFSLVLRGLRGYFVDEAGKKANLRISAALLEKVLGLRLEVRPKSIGGFSKNLQQFESVRSFIRLISSGIVIGKSTSAIKLKLENDVLYFFSGSEDSVTTDSAIAYFSSGKLYVNDVQVLSSLRIGGYAWVPESGNLNFKKIAG